MLFRDQRCRHGEGRVGARHNVNRHMTNGGYGFEFSRSPMMAPLMTASINQATPESAFFISTSMGRGVAIEVHTSIAKSRTRQTQATGMVLGLRQMERREGDEKEGLQEGSLETKDNHDSTDI